MRPCAIIVLVLAAALASCRPPSDPVAIVLVAPTSLTLRYSEVRMVDLEFRILAALDEGYSPRVFVHLYDEPGNVLRTFDLPFPSEWKVGSRVHHRLRIHQSALGPPLRAGRYSLSVGLYDIEGQRWPLQVGGLEIDNMEYAVAEIAVSESGAVPLFQFSEGWKEIEVGQDRQVLGRRWLEDQGSIRVTEPAEVRSVWMTLQVPNGEEGVSRLTLEAEATEPRVSIISSCGGAELELIGSGRHEVDLPLVGDDAGDGSECEIALRPNFYVVENGGSDRRTVLLEALAWSAEEVAAPSE